MVQKKDKKTNENKDEREPVFEENLVTPDRIKVWVDPFKKTCISIDGKEFSPETIAHDVKKAVSSALSSLSMKL